MFNYGNGPSVYELDRNEQILFDYPSSAQDILWGNDIFGLRGQVLLDVADIHRKGIFLAREKYSLPNMHLEFYRQHLFNEVLSLTLHKFSATFLMFNHILQFPSPTKNTMRDVILRSDFFSVDYIEGYDIV